MIAAQFDAEIHGGVLALPPEMKGEFEGQVHVILTRGEPATGDDLIVELLAAPLVAPDFASLPRDEAHERKH